MTRKASAALILLNAFLARFDRALTMLRPWPKNCSVVVRGERCRSPRTMSSKTHTCGYTLLTPPLERQLAMDAFRALPSGHSMVALLELDVTEALAAIEELQKRGTRLSLFAFVVRCIAIAIAEHPDLNLIRHGRRLVRFDDVDVSVPVEVLTKEGNFPRQIVIRRAQHKSVAQIYAEIEAARRRYEHSGETSDEDRWARRGMRSMLWLPGFVRRAFMRLFITSAFRIKARAGTTLVTSVGKFASVPGFSFTFSPGPRAAVFVVGGVVDKPWVHENALDVRSVLSLSIMIDHDLVDGAPAARFAARLGELIQSGEGLCLTRGGNVTSIDRARAVLQTAPPSAG